MFRVYISGEGVYEITATPRVVVLGAPGSGGAVLGSFGPRADRRTPMTDTSFEIRGEKELKKNEARDSAIRFATNEVAVSRKNSNVLWPKEDKAARDRGSGHNGTTSKGQGKETTLLLV